MSAGADGIELDVRLARDGVPVVIHDATLRRTGSVPASISRLDSKQLARVDVGSWFNRAKRKFARSEYAKERIPRLAQIFELCQSKPGTIYVEMKTEKDGPANELAKAVAKLVKEFKFYDRVVLISFNLATIETVKSVDSSLRTGALFGSTWMTGRNWGEKILAMTVDCGADELLLNRLLARRKVVAQAQNAELPVVVWTVDDARWVDRAGRFGLHALITNHPMRLLAAR